VSSKEESDRDDNCDKTILLLSLVRDCRKRGGERERSARRRRRPAWGRFRKEGEEERQSKAAGG
jgi:hypothetical protein